MVSFYGGLQAKSMTSQRYRAVTRWRICITMATLWQQQDGGYALLWKRYDNNDVPTFRWRKLWFHSSAYDCTFAVGCVYWACYRCILHLQQCSHRLNLFLFYYYYYYYYYICNINGLKGEGNVQIKGCNVTRESVAMYYTDRWAVEIS